MLISKTITKLFAFHFLNLYVFNPQWTTYIQTFQCNNQLVFDSKKNKQALVVRFGEIRVAGMAQENY